MSELKGQILGILLVLIVFGVMVTAFKAVFENTSARIVEVVSETISEAELA
jgi:hypothetical protein